MKCPTCTDTPLAMTNRQGIEIDYCQQCRGVWLDRGELDKLIERAGAAAGSPSASARRRSPPDFTDSDFGHDHGDRPRAQAQRKKSWLNDFFD